MSRLRKQVVALFLVAVLVGSLTGCGSGAAQEKQEPGVIKIGAAGPYTGDLSKIGLDSLNAIKFAVEEANAAGGVLGRKVEVAVADDGAEPAKAVLMAEKLAADPAVLGVIGPMNSNTVNAALPTYEKANLVVISQSATSTDLTEQGYKVMQRICPRDDAQGLTAARFIAEELKVKKVYILDDKSTYSQGLADQVEAGLKQRGGITSARGQVSAQDKDFAAILTVVKQFQPDLLYLALPNPAQAAGLIKQMKALGLKPLLMGGDGLKEKDQLIAGAAGEAEGMYVTAIGRDVREIPAAQDFVKKFEARYGAMSIYAGQSYEATKLLLHAIAQAGAKGGVPARADVLAAVKAISYQGILGFPIRFDAKGDVIGGGIFVHQVQGKDFVPVKEYHTGEK